MAKHAGERSRSTREDEQHDDEERDSENGHEPEAVMDEGELASYLEERIKPGLNRGAIPLLARSIAREIARDQYHSEDDDEAEDEGGENSDDQAVDLDLAGNLHKLQAQLGEDWVLSLCVQDGDSWLVAEKEDVTQRVEAADASVLSQAVKLLNEGGGRASSRAEKAVNSD